MRSRITMLMSFMILAGGGGPAAAQVSCDPFNDCIMDAVCQTDGTCRGVPKPNGSPCNPGAFTGNCATSGQCFTFGENSFCTPMDFQPVGTPCTPPGLEGLGACLLSAQCQEGGGCVPQIKECPQPSDLCMVAFCDPSDGQCSTVPNTCQGPCYNATCDPNTGQCVDMQPINDGQECGSGGACAGPLVCRNGDCIATATPPTEVCVGDCGGTLTVLITNIITLVNIVLGSAQPSACAQGIPAGAQVNITLIIQAVNNVLAGCPAAPAQACVAAGGTVTSSLCCLGVEDFPNTCAIGPCGCSPELSHTVQICDCAEGKCFAGASAGCVSP